MVSAVLDGGRSAVIHEFCFQAAKRSDIVCVDCKGVNLLILTNSGFRVQNVEICAVLSSSEVDLLIHRNRVFRQRNDQKCEVQS